MPVSKNTWNKGLNSDLSKLKSQPDSYLDAKNIRVITDEGSSTFAIENIRGNRFDFKLPPIESTYSIKIIPNSSGIATINLQRSVYYPQSGLSVLETATFQIVNIESKSYEFIANELNDLIQDPALIFTGKQYIRFYYNSGSVILYDFKPESEVNLSSLIVTENNIEITQRTSKVNYHTILGWGVYNDNVVLISCDFGSISEDPVDSEGFLWDITYNNATSEIISSQLDGVYLNPDTTLKYAGNLSLSRNYAISEHLKCRYESTEVTRVVWTDWYNNLRTCNINDPQIWGTPEELFSYIPLHLPQKPIIEQIIQGGTLPTGKYQYFYQLYSTQGAKSTYSPVSSLISLFPGDISKYVVTGDKPGINSQKSVKIQLTNLDTNYDIIRIGYIVYQIADFPEAFFFDERFIPKDGFISIVHNGNENDIPVDSTEIANLNRPPEVFKTLDVVRNRLFAANAITKYFDPVFDARAYRFNSSRISKLYNSNDTINNPSVLIDAANNTISIEGNSPQSLNYSLIPDKFDVINPFNDENPDISLNPLSAGSWETNSQYKYKSDGVTLGGEGLNISYEFITDIKLAKLAGLPDVTPYIRPAMDSVSDFTVPFTDTYTYYLSDNTSLDSMKNPYIESLFTGYSRGEVYRFGIVFYDIYGYPSYVNWIGDIKFPFAYDSDGYFGLTENKVGAANSELVSPAITDIVDGLNLPANQGGDFSIVQSISEFKIYALSPDSSQVIQLSGPNGNYVWDPDSNDTVTDFRIDFNNATLSFTDAVSGISTNVYCTAFSLANIQFYLNSVSSVFLGWKIRIIRRNKINGNLETCDLVLKGELLSNAIGELYTKQIGIKFTLNIQNDQFQAIKNQISGWSYVRVRRDVSNSTRLGTGYVHSLLYVFDNLLAGCYTLTPFYRDNNSTQLDNDWYFKNQAPDQRTVNRLQTFYAPNFLTRKAGFFITGDYMRMIGRTNDFGFLNQYSQKIFTLPNWPANTELYYLASADFNYTYDDTFTSMYPDSDASSSLDSTSKNKFTIVGRTYVTYSTTQNTVDANIITGLDFPFINMAASDLTDSQNNEYMEWGNACELISYLNKGPDVTYDNSSILRLPIYLASYERYLTSQYGGWLRSDRYANEYILTNHFQPWDKNNSEALYSNGLVTNGVFGGDTYVNYFDWQRSNINYKEGSGWDISSTSGNEPFGLAVFFPCESSFNTELNINFQHASNRADTVEGSYSIFPSSYIYNDALSQQNTTNLFISKALNQTNVVREPHTIYGTEPKLDNERLDSWRSFLINNALTVNGNYGEINRLVQFKDKLFYYQNDGFGVASVDERVLADEGATSQTQLGTGTLLQRFDYVSTETGAKHSFAVKATGSAIYHYDAFINKLFRYSTTKAKDGTSSTGVSPLTDVNGLSGFFRTAFVNTELKTKDKILLPPTKQGTPQRCGIVSGYNSEYNTVYFTFFVPDGPFETSYTIAYNELLESFESFCDFYPSLYLNMRKRFLSINPSQTSEVYTHNLGLRNTFYGTTFPSYIKFRVNENSDFVKTFDNFIINTEVIDVATNQQLNETITSYGISNDYQIVNERIANFTEKIRSWRLQIPRDETNPNLTIKPRMSDKYIDVLFKHTINGGDKIFRLHDVMTEYSLRSKILPR